jgi:hypothetical protein
MLTALHYTPHAIITSLVAVIGWFGKRAYCGVADELKEAKDKLVNIEAITKNTAENHLLHLQEEAFKQTGLLENLVTSQAETNGTLKVTNDLLLRTLVEFKK